MRNKFEHFLLLLLLTTSILLGLSFWLYTIFGFNLFYHEHWSELARLQASHQPIDIKFYISIIVAILIFVICTYLIYTPDYKKIKKQKAVTHIQTKPQEPAQQPVVSTPEPEKFDDSPIPIPRTPASRPPRLRLPSNMAEIVAKRQSENQIPKNTNENQQFEKIFSDNGYVIKPNPRISGFTPNLFAIGTDEIVWIGAADIKDLLP